MKLELANHSKVTQYQPTTKMQGMQKEVLQKIPTVDYKDQSISQLQRIRLLLIQELDHYAGLKLKSHLT